MSEKPIYLDYNATTPVAPEVLEAMLPVLREDWGNPSAAHAYGRAARARVDAARRQVAELLGCESDEIVFTSGGTESDNAAVIGIAEARSSSGRHIVTSTVEHAAVGDACSYLETRGWEITRVGVDRAGVLRLEELRDALRPDTVLVSIMQANNETGAIQPVDALREALGSHGAVIHTDAAQAVGKVDCRVNRLDVDALTVAGHKLYAPKGVGALYLRRGTPFARTFHGAPHEAGRRAGTENVALIAALGHACELARREGDERARHMRSMRDLLETRLRAAFDDLVVHGAAAPRLPNTSLVAIPRTSAVELLAALPGLAASSGAACHSGKPHVSSTLKAMDVDESTALATMRLSVGRSTTEEQIERAATLIIEAARRQRAAAVP